MRKITVLVLSIIISVSFLTNCKKYDYGPFISFKTKQTRLVNKWKLSKVLREDKDVSNEYFSVAKEYTIEFKEDGTVEKTMTDNNGTVYPSSAVWEFNYDKSGINAILIDVFLIYYDIQKLTTTELWLYKENYSKTRFEFVRY